MSIISTTKSSQIKQKFGKIEIYCLLFTNKQTNKKKPFLVAVNSIIFTILEFLPATSGKQMTASLSRRILLYDLFNVTSC
jgi:hypothetical protein